MSGDVTAEALRMACRELAQLRQAFEDPLWTNTPSEADVDDVVAGMLAKAAGFPAEGSVEVPE